MALSFLIIPLTSHLPDELGKQLTITQQLLTEVMPNPSEDGAKALGALKELKEVAQQLSQELQR